MAETGDTGLMTTGNSGGRSCASYSPGARRYIWTSRLDYILTLIGYTVGLGSLWRFPYVCRRNGGGAFLIPYLIFMTTVAVPLFFLEVVIGQFSRRGPIGAWGLCPLMKGIGIGQVILSGLAVPYYTVVFTWSLIYLYKSFSPVLPWTTCADNHTTPCLEHADLSSKHLQDFRFYSGGINMSTVSPAELYWRENVLGMSTGLEEAGTVQIHLVIAWIIACVIIFFCVIKGMKAVGKVVYVTALLPYFLLAVLLVRTCMMPGAVDGLLFFVTPDFTRLADYQVWVDALIQVFFSVGPAWGAVITISSHNSRTSNPAWDAFIVAVVGVVTSVLAGLVVFATLGFISREVNTPIEHAVSYGPGLIFIVYPAAVSQLPVPQLWSVLLFLMLLMLSIDSTIGCLETVVITLEDHVTQFLPTLKHSHALLAAIVMTVVVFLGLPFTMNNGIYVFVLLDKFIASVSPLVIAVLECFTISWFYGIRRLSVDLEYMLGRQPPVIFKLLCCILTPALLIIVQVAILVKYKPLKYEKYDFPFYATVIGWCIAVLPLLPIPVTVVIQVFRRRGSLRQKLSESFKPDSVWESSTQRYRAEEYDMWLDEKTSVSENARFIFIRENPE